MIKDIQEINFPEYATLSQATVTLNDMGDRTISAQVKIDGSIVPDFSYDWEIEFKGERYIQPLRQPQASKGNNSMSSIIDLTFYHWAIWELKRYYFVEMTSTESGTAIADKYIASLGLNLSDFCVAFQKVLDHYFDGEIVVNLNPNWEYDIEPSSVSISYSYIWDVLQQIYDIYGVRWDISTNNGICYINIGYVPNEVSHIFQYGYEGGLLKIERQVQDANIRNSLLGRGGEQNLPAYYFKEAPEGSLFASDPDAIPELANIYFSNLRGKTFRDYVKGWKAAHYGGKAMPNPTEEYTKGYTDKKFNPIEYVKDDASIAKYGLLQGALENNEKIHPSIQGAPNGEDVVVYVEPITSDDVEPSIEKETIVEDIESVYATIDVAPYDIAEGQIPLNDISVIAIDGAYITYSNIFSASEEYVSLISGKLVFIDKQTNERFEGERLLPVGSYTCHFEYTIENSNDYVVSVTVGAEQIKMTYEVITREQWLPTFDIWVKNIWGSTRNTGESDEAYAERIWRPILGDRQGDEAKVVFSTGWLSGHNDYEFTIVDFAYDNSKSYDGVQSEWRLTLNKSEAELDSMGVYIPSVAIQANAGDKFFFIGIDMPHQYVIWAEEKLDYYKRDSLIDTANIKSTWVLSLDKIRINENRGEALTLLDQMNIGSLLRASHSPFIEDEYIELYIQSITYTFGEALLPNVEVVLSDKVISVKNPVAQLQGEVDALSKQVGSISNIKQVVLSIGDKTYIRKNRPDTARGKISFQNGADFYNYKEGGVDGSGATIRQDLNGKSTLEIDNILARLNSIFGGSLKSPDFISDLTNGKGWAIQQKEVTNATGAVEKRSAMELDDLTVRGVLRVFEFVISQMLGENDNRTFTGMMEVDHYDAEEGKIYLDTQNGKLYNPFRVDDIVVVQQYNPNNAEGYITKQYEMVITEVGVGNISDGEDRLDWVKFSNFTTTMEGDASTLISEGDTLVRLDNLTDDQRKGIIQIMSVGESTPYMDVLYGAKTDPDNALKVRIGNLAGIYNALFGNLTGFGAFLSNLYGVGEFRIQHTGEDVASKLEMTRNGFSTNFRKVAYNLPDADNYLDNPSFLDNMASWVAGESEVNFFLTAQNEPIYMNRNIYAESSQFVGLDEYNGRELLRITASQIKQLNANIKEPTFHREYDPEYVEGESEGNPYADTPDTMYLTIKYYCTQGGTLEIGFVDGDGDAISVTDPNALSYYQYSVVASINEQEQEIIGIWEGKGDFVIKTDGEVFIESVALSTRPLDNYKIETSTSIEQSSESIALIGQKVDTISGEYTNLRAEVNTATESINLLAEQTDEIESSVSELKVATDGLSSTVATVQGDVATAKKNAKTALSEARAAADTANSAAENAATAIAQSSNAVTIYAANFDDDGSIKADGYLAVFVNDEVSNIKLTADNVDINGIVQVSKNTIAIGGFEVTSNSLTNANLESYIRISEDSGLLNHWVALNDPDADGIIDVYTNRDIGINVKVEQNVSVGTKRVAIKAIGNSSLLGRYSTESSKCESIMIKGLAVGYNNNEASSFYDGDGYWYDLIVAPEDGPITLPNPSLCPGKVLFIKGNGTNRYSTSGTAKIVMPNKYTPVDYLDVPGGRSIFFIATDTRWITFTCFYLD